MLFLEEEFLRANGIGSFYSIESNENSFNFFKDENKWFAPYRAPFGGIADMSREEMMHLYKAWVSSADEAEVPLLSLRLPPECYGQQITEQIEVLTELGFVPETVDLNQHLLTERDYYGNLDSAAKNKYNKCSKEGVVFKAGGVELLAAAYKVIAQNRKDKGYPVTMSLKQLELMFHAFPADFKVGIVILDDEIIAASILIFVSPKILYTFYLGHKLEFNKLSPLVYLVGEVHNLAQSRDMDVVDLGISSEQGVKNAGLHDFKRYLGALETNKYTMVRNKG